MRYQEITQEAESGTKESKQIVDTLRKAGYTQLGEGADATVWTKDEGTIIKIIMPEDGERVTDAANTFHKFYEFCQQNQNIANLPRFVSIGGQHHAKFTIGNKEYIQVAMERLYPLQTDSFEEAMVWIMSDLSSKRLNWDQAYKKMLDPVTWQYWEGPQKPEDFPNYIKSLNKMALVQYKVLYTLMVVLFHTGRINKFGWDLHTENVMRRKDGTLVVIDPWFSADEFED